VTVVVESKLRPDGACPLLILLPYTSKYVVVPETIRDEIEGKMQYHPYPNISEASYSALAGMLLAIDHFNTGVYQSSTGFGCNVYFPTPKVMNARMDTKSAMKAFLQYRRETGELPCAVIAPWDVDSILALNTTLSAFEDIPLINYGAELDEVVSVSLSAHGRATVMAKYLHLRQYLSVWHTGSPQEVAITKYLQQMPELEVQAFVQPQGDDAIRAEILRMKLTGITTILVNLDEPGNLPQLPYFWNNWKCSKLNICTF
jgi:hypothetical protein